jgi:hypothetical protein
MGFRPRSISFMVDAKLRCYHRPSMARLLLFVVCVTTLGAQAAAQPQSPARPLTDEEQIRFLRTAEIVKATPIGKGVTRPFRLTLQQDGFTHDAAFQSVDERSSDSERRDGVRRAGESAFVDAYRYNIAAYRLAVLLGIGHMIPATAERTWSGRRGALTWWVDDVLMDEEERERKNAEPPSPQELNRQRQRMFVFAELIRDTDRNKGNVIYTKEWKVVMIDFTRAFRLQRELRSPQLLQTCDRKLLAAMRSLTRNTIEDAVDDSLTTFEIDSILARRTLIVERFDQLVRERGEAAVLY